MNYTTKTVALVALLSAALGFAAGWGWRRHTHPSAQERYDRAARELKKGLFGE